MSDEKTGTLPVDVRAADVLANERTFLAYIRTSLSFVAFGFVVARFGLFVEQLSVFTKVESKGPHYSTIFGVSMAIVGIVIGILRAQRYTASDLGLRRRVVIAMPRATAYVVTIAVAVIGFVVAIFLGNFH